MSPQRTEQSAMARNCVTIVGSDDGQVLLLAHGFGCDQGVWRRLAPFLAEDRRLVLFDHVGAGHSDVSAYDPHKYASPDGYTSDLLEICTELDLQDVIVVAHSVSTMLAIAAAVAEPDRFSRLVLITPSPRFVDDAAHDYVGGFSQEDMAGLLESIDGNYLAWAEAMAPTIMGSGSPQLGEELTKSFCRLDPRIAREFARVAFLGDARDLLPQVSTPTLILQCSEDPLVPEQVGRYVHERIPGSTLVQLAATGHCPHVSAPAETADAILRYLNDA